MTEAYALPADGKSRLRGSLSDLAASAFAAGGASSPTLLRVALTASFVAYISIFAFGAFVLFYEFWLNERQSALLGDVAPMSPATAACFIVSSFAFLGYFRPIRPKMIARVGVAVIAAAAATDLVLLATGVGGGIDALLAPGEHGVMSPATSLCFLCAAVTLHALYAQSGAKDRQDQAIVASATIGLAISALAFVAYLFAWRRISEVELFAAMSPFTAASFVAMFAAALLIRPDAGWASVFTRSCPTSMTARRLLVVALLAPLFCCYAMLEIMDVDESAAGFFLSVPAVASTAMMIAAIYWGARLGNAQSDEIEATLEELRVTVADRDLLLRELNHRVKNNLQQTNAILFLEKSQITDAKARDAMQRMSERICALGAVHEILTGTERTSIVALPDFLNDLIGGMDAALTPETRGVRLTVRAAEPEMVEIDVAISIGLLVHEIVTNALKHAFPEGHGGVISVAAWRENATRRIEISDNGVGGKTDAADDEDHGERIGSLLIEGLVAQLGGSLTVSRDVGTTVKITMPAFKRPEAAV